MAQLESEINHGSTGAALTRAGLRDQGHVRMALQQRTQRLSQDSHAHAVHNPNARQSRQEGARKREGMKIGGLVNMGVGIGLMIFLHALVKDAPVYLCGLIPGLIGVALLTYALFLAPPLE